MKFLIPFVLLWGLVNLFMLDDRDHVESEQQAKSDPAEIFQQRIMPIFRSPKPSSCVQCHLASVDLKHYILPSHEQTFVSLRDQGLIDVDHPERSKILKLIQMGEQDRDRGARLIHQEMRQAEFEAFAHWIKACCQNQRLLKLPPLQQDALAKPEPPDEVIRHGRKSRVVDSFVRNVWSQRMRCFPCHTPHDIKPNQEKALEKFADFESQYGDQMRIFQRTPAATVRHLLEQSRQRQGDDLPLINLEQPHKSLLVLKPTSKLPKRMDGQFQPPSNEEPVTHMGGLKMHVDDQSYKSFIAWIEDYANVVEGRYTNSTELPPDNWFATRRILRMRDASESWPVGTPVQLMVHAWLPDQDTWSSEPVAFTQGTVTPRRIVNGSLFLLAPVDPAQRQAWKQQRPKLPAGRYLVKVYADLAGRMDTDPALILGPQELVGQVEMEHAQWRVGFPKAEWISAESFEPE